MTGAAIGLLGKAGLYDKSTCVIWNVPIQIGALPPARAVRAAESGRSWVRLVQYWFSLDGVMPVLRGPGYWRVSAKSLFYGDTTIRKGRAEVPMDHLLGCRWNMYC